jgi:hypothetical protein
MRCLLATLALAYLLLITGAVTSTSEMIGAQGTQATSTPSSRAAVLGHTNSSSYYRM